jgi:hypothetical protein
LNIAVVTSFAPYLGGPATWSRLAGALPAGDALEIVDLLDIAADGSEPYDAAVRAIAAALTRGVHAVVAHGAAVGAAVDAVARVRRDLPLVAVGPIYAGEARSLVGRMMLPLLCSPAGATMLAAFAARKLRKLRTSRDAVREQLELLVREDAIDDALVDEAVARVADARTAALAARSGVMLRAMTREVDAAALGAVPRRVALLGAGARTRKLRANLVDDDWEIVETNGDAPMLEDPYAVVRALRCIM